MQFIKSILRSFVVAEVIYSDSTTFDMVFRRGRYVADDDISFIDIAKSDVKDALVIVVVVGCGIISRQEDGFAGILAKVRGDFQTFLCNNNRNGVVSFIRRDQLSPLMDSLTLDKINFACLTCCPSIEREAEIRQIVREYYRTNINFKTLIKPSEAGYPVAMQLVRKIRMPVLCLILLMLTANTIIRGYWEDKSREINMQYQTLQRNAESRNNSTQQQNEMLTKYSHHVLNKCGWKCDRIASVTPQGVLLTVLDVQPMLKQLEDGKQPVLANDNLSIKGVSVSADKVSMFVSALKKLKIFNNIKLSQIERKDKDIIFKIDIEL